MQGADGSLDLENNFSQVAVALFAAVTVEGTLRRIVDLALIAVDACEAAGVILFDDRVATAAASSVIVAKIDQIQIDAEEGPGYDASTVGSSFFAEDLIDEKRWRVFAPAAVAEGIRSVLACPLSTERPGALNLYARLPAAFGATDRATGQLYATLAGLALNAAEERASDEKRAANLIEALRTRELIGQAQGILMERERISAEQAFDVLRRASQHRNVKLRAVAETLVHTGVSPETELH